MSQPASLLRLDMPLSLAFVAFPCVAFALLCVCLAFYKNLFKNCPFAFREAVYLTFVILTLSEADRF